MNGSGHVSPSQRYRQAQVVRQPAVAAATSRTGARSNARNKSYSEIAAERARKSAQSKSHPAQSQSQQRQQQQQSQQSQRAQPQRIAGQVRSPQGVVTKYRDITEIPDGYGPVRFDDDSGHDEDSLAQEDDNLRRSGFHQPHDNSRSHSHRYAGSSGGFEDCNDDGETAEEEAEGDESEFGDQYRYEPRHSGRHASNSKQRSTHMSVHASYRSRRDELDDGYGNEEEDDDIDAQIARLQSQLAQYDSRESVSKGRAQPGNLRPDAPEPKPMSKRELLVYSKKARPVEFRPYTLKDYKKNHKHAGYYEVGSLQPDLNTEELRAKRENLQRVKEFSRQLREYNARAAAVKPPTQEPTSHAKEPSTRDKALEFAKSIPKPKAKLSAMKQAQVRNGRVSDGGREQLEDEEAVGLTRSRLDELEVEHERARKQVEAIKRSLGF